jgi:hypothetical protein
MKVSFALAAVLLLACQAKGQRFSFGVKGGTQLSDTSRSAEIDDRFSGYGLWSLSTRRYTVGGTFEVRVPFGLYVEVDALYKRTDTTQHGFFSPSFGTITRLTANSWEFPMLLKHRWDRRFHPFAALGGTFRRIEGFDTSVERFAYGLNPPYSVYRYRIDQPLTQGGIASGVGMLLLSVGHLEITPELRYTRWTSISFLPTQNQVEILMGLGF